MARRFTKEEKGKSVATSQTMQGYRRIRAPEIDSSALIRDNALTLIGRTLNTREQPVEALIAALNRKWNLRGHVSGSDLGQSCFQFRFELEEDMKAVLAGRPYHYNHWMLILQQWEPVISPLFPSQIPFWIRLHGIPLHFWHEKMIYNVGQDLGTLADYKITKSSVRIQVIINGLEPLTKKALIEFDQGEDLPISLEYEALEYHCSNCNRLTHLARTCPDRNQPAPRRDPPSARLSPSRRNNYGEPQGPRDRAPLHESTLVPVSSLPDTAFK